VKFPASPLDLAKLKYIKVRYNKYPDIKTFTALSSTAN
jgi:hypothetical protein